VKSWTLAAPGWTVTGAPYFLFPAIPLHIYIPPKAIISDFSSWCKFKKQIFRICSSLFVLYLFLPIPSLHLANPTKGSEDKKYILRQIEKNKKRKINDQN
jgi:hypothetical protein